MTDEEIMRQLTQAVRDDDVLAPPGQGTVVRREAACGIAADNLLTGQEASTCMDKSTALLFEY